MTTPDEEITGYGGLPKTGPDNTSSATTSSTSTAGHGASSSASTSSGGAGATEDAKAKARQVADQAKAQGRSQLDGYRETAADELERVAQGAKAAAEQLEGDDRFGLSGYVSDMAQSMVRLSDDLRGKSVDELVQDVNRLARNNPALFITGSIALGFGLTRFARASSKRAAEGDYSSHRPSMHSHRDDDSQHSSSQQDLNDRLNTGEPGTIGSVSNAGVSSATSTSRQGVGTGAATGVGTSSSSTDLSNGLGVGSNPASGLSSSNRNGKGTDGGLYP